MANWNEVFAQCNMAAANQALAASSDKAAGLPPGDYIGQHKESDVATYERNGDHYPRFAMVFEITASPENPSSVGRQHTVWFRLGPTFDDGSSPDAGRLKGIYEKLFGEACPSLPDGSLDAQAVCERVAKEGMGAKWALKIKPGKNGYTNTFVNGIVAD